MSVSASPGAPSDAKPRDRPIAARRAARVARFEREKLIVDHLKRGVPVAEIAERVGVTGKRMWALVKEILARRMPAAPEEYAAVQVSRLSEALMVAYSAMSPDNLRAIALVVRIVRELDRYHGFMPVRRRAPLLHEMRKAAGETGRLGCGEPDSNNESGSDRSCDRAAAEAAGHTPSGPSGRLAQQSRGRRAPPATGAETAPEAIEKMESKPEYGALPDDRRAAPSPVGTTLSAGADDRGAEAPAPRAGAEMALERIENIESTPEALAVGGDLDEAAPRAASPQEPAALVLAVDPAAPGGFRRMRIRMLFNGVVGG